MLINVLCCFRVAGESSCQVENVQSYSTSDGIVIANVAHIGTFTLQCRNKQDSPTTLYAEVNGKTLPAIRSSDGKTYQVSSPFYLFLA